MYKYKYIASHCKSAFLDPYTDAIAVPYIDAYNTAIRCTLPDTRAHMHMQAFIIPLEVHNYALKPKAREEQDQIQEILERRKVEIAERKVRSAGTLEGLSSCAMSVSFCAGS